MEGKGAHGGNRNSSNIVLLEDMGITKMQSSRWQMEASVPGVIDIKYTLLTLLTARRVPV